MEKQPEEKKGVWMNKGKLSEKQENTFLVIIESLCAFKRSCLDGFQRKTRRKRNSLGIEEFFFDSSQKELRNGFKCFSFLFELIRKWMRSQLPELDDNIKEFL